MPVQSMVESLNRSRNLQEVYEACECACEAWDFDYFHFCGRIRGFLNKPRFVFVSNYPQAWWDYYNENNLLFQDPVVHYCSNHSTPVLWDRFFQCDENDIGGSINVLEKARQFGLNYGISAPVHSSQGNKGAFNMVSAAAPELKEGQLDERISHVHLLAAHVHEAVCRLAQRDESDELLDSISGREQECLLWAAEGKTTWETAQILNISERTVLFHMQNAMKKLGATNKSHAVARAICYGIISPG